MLRSGRARAATALSALTPKGADAPKSAGRGGGFRGSASPPRNAFWPAPELPSQGAASPHLEPAASLQTASSLASQSSQVGACFKTNCVAGPVKRLSSTLVSVTQGCNNDCRLCPPWSARARRWVAAPCTAVLQSL